MCSTEPKYPRKGVSSCCSGQGLMRQLTLKESTMTVYFVQIIDEDGVREPEIFETTCKESAEDLVSDLCASGIACDYWSEVIFD